MSATVTAIISFRLTTAEPARLACFYQGFGFTLGKREVIAESEMGLLGLRGRGTRLPLRLGATCIDLDSFDEPGRAYPTNATSADLCFQHLALVTHDAAAAWGRASSLGAVPISVAGAVKLPASAGGVTALKFRDPEGHPLELLEFPSNRAKQFCGTGLLGIDHSAISVSDAGASRYFYEALGLSVHGPTVNQGLTQAALDGLLAPVVDVIPMIPRGGDPHLELLAYRTPIGRSLDRLRANDVSATRIVWAADQEVLMHDPDGHLHLLLCSAKRSQPVAAAAGGGGCEQLMVEQGWQRNESHLADTPQQHWWCTVRLERASLMDVEIVLDVGRELASRPTRCVWPM